MWDAIKESLAGGGEEAPEAASEKESPFELTADDVPVERTEANAELVDALTEVIDPELGVNIVDLGLVYALEVDDEAIRVAVTATTPACPMSGVILRDVEGAVRGADPGEREVEVHLVWEPAWAPDFMSERAKEQLGW